METFSQWYLFRVTINSHNISHMLLVHNNQTRFEDIQEHPVHTTI